MGPLTEPVCNVTYVCVPTYLYVFLDLLKMNSYFDNRYLFLIDKSVKYRSKIFWNINSYRNSYHSFGIPIVSVFSLCVYILFEFKCQYKYKKHSTSHTVKNGSRICNVGLLLQHNMDVCIFTSSSKLYIASWKIKEFYLSCVVLKRLHLFGGRVMPACSYSHLIVYYLWTK